MLEKLHGDADSDIHIGSHFAEKTIAHKILRTGYY
jgi:hypothetical protein